MNRLDEKFRELKENGRAALMPYLPLGYPTLEVSRELIRAVCHAGADILELGMPFSDPLADGPAIQHATQVALQNGMTMNHSLDMVLDARTRGVTIPLVLMGYYNPILKYGIEKFARDAFEVGADGVIVPDLPIEEADSLQRALHHQDVHLVLLAAPTSGEERLRKIGAATRGFLYLVSVTGVTGERDSLPEGLEEFVLRARAVTDKPICVGFGISNAETAQQVAKMADGVIIGSALVTRIGEPQSAVENATSFITEMRRAM
ncbi:MAG TPA: tryptophan synthase subunit alpha [Anaerolineae bacterium]|nr:tryptophan synthase subunit alpha [Anaerolineae bacterium]